MGGKVYLVATPIGNLGDITFRAVEVLRSVDIIACEDTRHSRKLLEHLNIKAKLVSYHEHNEAERSTELIKKILDGISVAIISDAGTPAISDPSFRIVQDAVAAEIDVVPIPGAVAFVNAAIVSGLATDSLFYGGFLPSKQSERRRRLAEVKDIPATLAFYESPHRIARSLADCVQVLGDRNAVIARELTKMHEELIRGTLKQLSEKINNASIKGEIVLLIDRADESAANDHSESDISQFAARLETAGHTPKEVLKMTAKQFGLSRAETYRRLMINKS